MFVSNGLCEVERIFSRPKNNIDYARELNLALHRLHVDVFKLGIRKDYVRENIIPVFERAKKIIQGIPIETQGILKAIDMRINSVKRNYLEEK